MPRLRRVPACAAIAGAAIAGAVIATAAACSATTGDPRTGFLVNTLTADNQIWIDRDPALVEGKYRKMASRRFDFFRGTAGQYWRDVTTVARGLATGALVAAALAACAGAESAPDASPLIDAPPEVDADGRCPLALNEVAAAGQPTDWFELVNVSAAPVDLAGFRFIDEVDDPAAAVPFTAVVLSPGARHVEEVTDAVSGFQLGADDALWIYRIGATTACDGVDWSAGDAPSGGSYGRVPDATGGFETTTPDTRGVPNR